jgi:hypothetical protein
MNWQCRLYGHQWRHPGQYEVILTEGAVPAYPFRCAVCESEMLLDGGDERRSPTPGATTDEPEPRSEIGSEHESPVERDSEPDRREP